MVTLDEAGVERASTGDELLAFELTEPLVFVP
jgi:hypothetical protein